ncbi:unnamed protein product [Musa acuminata subsp. malaccensis]|uniref:(wild Malaysian banana) hypothetical protein n=1 Tax=Musa acuminata subsp. malaccensis TaxID=214687 RepID=A0A804ISX5_MUSAM|nr:unnamed protein product [Musa acuminata subsp. malaccensis]
MVNLRCLPLSLGSWFERKRHRRPHQRERGATEVAKPPPPNGPQRGAEDPKTRYPVVVRFNKVNHAAVSTKKYALDEILENSLWIGELKDCALQACQSKMDDNP